MLDARSLLRIQLAPAHSSAGSDPIVRRAERPRRQRAAPLVVLAAFTVGGCLRAAGAPPAEQFAVWGSAGPKLPPPPPGWSEVKAGDDLLPPAAPSADELRRELIVFTRESLAGIASDSLPANPEKVTGLSSFAARGQYEPISFALHALADQSDVSVTVSELQNGSSTIPTDQIDVRVVRPVREIVDAAAKTYRMLPFLLEKREAFAIPKDTSIQVWITIHVPTTAQSGPYVGKIVISSSRRDPVSVPLRLRVLPFALPQTPIEMAMSFENPSDSDDMLQKQLIDLREHGINSMEPMLAVAVKSRDQSFGEDDAAATRESARRRVAAIRRIFGPWRFPVTFEVGNQITCAWNVQKGWFDFWPHSEKIDGDFLRAIGVIREVARNQGLPALRCYAIDEAGAHNLLDEAVYYHKMIMSRMPDVGSYTTIGGGIAMGYDEIAKLSDCVDLISTNRFTPEIAQALVTRGKPFGVYNGCRDTAASAAFFFGFYGWKTGASQILQWAYTTDDGGFWKRGTRDNGEGFVYNAPDGPIPSLLWEGVRKGIDDYRLIDLLWRQAAAARGSGKPGAVAAADHAEKTLKDILARIPWTYQAMTYEGRTPPPSGSTLRKWRWRVAQEIVRLQAIVAPVASGAPNASARPGSLDLPWPAPERDGSTYGSEILPPSGFESGLKPWRIENWSSKAANSLDTAEHHTGKQCVRVDVPADTSTSGVTVVDWPNWVGGEVLKLTLNAGRIYEFSAWVKVKDRGSLPVMRFGLPDGAALSTRDGQDPAEVNGWRRIWTRIEMAFGAQPTYIAVWIQGPGTVWVDDLSLREVTPPPCSLTLDQEEYDAADRVGAATLTVSRQTTPSRLRFQLVPQGGKPAAEMTIPFHVSADIGTATGPNGSQMTAVTPTTLRTCRIGFQPSSLPPGVYHARIDLLDAGGEVIGSASVPFRALSADGE